MFSYLQFMQIINYRDLLNKYMNDISNVFDAITILQKTFEQFSALKLMKVTIQSTYISAYGGQTGFRT